MKDFPISGPLPVSVIKRSFNEISSSSDHNVSSNFPKSRELV